jgi:hypothetical protein
LLHDGSGGSSRCVQARYKERHTSQELKKVSEEGIASVDLPTRLSATRHIVGALTTDSAANMLGMFDDEDCTTHLPCSAHKLQLVLVNGVKDTFFEHLIGIARSISAKILLSPLRRAVLE